MGTQSGSVSNAWAVATPEDMLARSKEFAAAIGCSNSTYEEMAYCLRNAKITAQIMQDNSWPLTNLKFLQFPLVPITVDVNFFEGENVFKSLQTGNFKKCPVIMGTNTDEGTFWLPYNYPKIFNESGPSFLAQSGKPYPENLITSQSYDTAVHSGFSSWFNSSLLIQSIGYLYAPEDTASPGKGYRDAVGNFVDDFFFTCDVLDTARVLSAHGSPVYLYYFDQRSSANPWPKWMGVMHGYEIEYVFGLPLAPRSDYTYESGTGEVQFARDMMSLWTGFARDGSFETGSSWQVFRMENRTETVKILKSDLDASGRSVGPSWDKCEYWWSIGRAIDSRKTECSRYKRVSILR